MSRKNPFHGEGCQTEFAKIVYKRFMSREWVTYANVLEEYLEQPLSHKISNYKQYNPLKKAFSAIRKSIGENHFEKVGNTRNRQFRYIGKDNNPLANMKNAKVIDNLHQYWKFCQDSAGFFPSSWLEYFFKDCQDLIEMKTKKQRGEQVISSSLDRSLTNIEYLPMLYEAIVNKQVLEIDYKAIRGEQETLTFHPHYLKEYNGRWNLFGHAEGHKPDNGYCLSIDRMLAKPRENPKIKYKQSPAMFYKKLFDNIVGLSHKEKAQIYNITIRAHTEYMFGLTETKPLHHSQKTVTPWKKQQNGTYGEFSIRVEINSELIGRILQMGAELEVVSPPEVRKIFIDQVAKLSQRYNNIL